MRRPLKLALAGIAAGSGLLLLTAGVAGAQSTPPDIDTVNQAVSATQVSLNLLWVVIGAVLVIFMQAGFALVETGFCRAKHAAHVVSTNFAIFGLGFVAFFVCGFAFAFSNFSFAGIGLTESVQAPSTNGLIGSGNWVFLWGKGGYFLSGISPALLPAAAAFFLYMVAFMDTTATIPTGSMAERWKWKSFVGWGLFCGAIYYPLFAGFTWGGGWLAKLGESASLGFGYVDFAGSGVVHAMGGIAALAGALVLGPRIGKFGKDGKPRALPGHHIPMAMLGTFILLFGWFGFNAASTLSAVDVQFATVATNTAAAAAFGATAGMAWIMLRTGKPDPGMMANGMLAGLVAITAPCAFVDPWAAALIGVLAGVIVIESIFIVERKFKIDDPVGAISVHGVNGIFGVLCIGLFASGRYGSGWNGTTKWGDKGVSGIFGFGDKYDFSLGLRQLVAQVIGCLVIIFVMGGIAFAFFKIQNKFTKGGIRPTAEDELAGLDLPEMGVQAYPEFAGGLGGLGGSDTPPSEVRTPVST